MGPRCLIVDDNAFFREAAQRLLERQGVIVVGAASNVADALLDVRRQRPDVVLVDIELGAESGLDLARRLALVDPAGSVRVILTSMRSQADVEDLIAGTPTVGFLPKSELSAAAVRRLLEAASGPPGT